MALLSDGTVKAWGHNGNGELGGSGSGRTPVSVTGITNAAAVSSAEEHFLALLSDGTIKAWGHNTIGQFGDGTISWPCYMVSVSGITNAVAVSTRGDNSLALLSDGTVKAWGLTMMVN